MIKWPSKGDIFPTWTNDAKKATGQEFQRFWVAGTVGGFLATLMRSIPLDLRQLAYPPDWLYTADLLMRYGYLAWFIGYFFSSNLRTKAEAIKKGEIAFEILQTLCSFAAAFLLGFVVPGMGFGYDASSLAFLSANAAIVVLCGFSLCLGGEWPIVWLRGAGLVLAVLAMSWISLGPGGIHGVPVLVGLAAILVTLFVLLLSYGRYRSNRVVSDVMDAGSPCPRAEKARVSQP
jgi:hypothetical protein